MKFKTVPGTVMMQICGRFFLATAEGDIEVTETGYVCLQCLEHGADMEGLQAALEERFDADKKTLSHDVQDFLHDLLDRRLLVRISGDGC